MDKMVISEMIGEDMIVLILRSVLLDFIFMLIK